MGKEDIGMEPEDHDETLKKEEEIASLTDNEEIVKKSEIAFMLTFKEVISCTAVNIK